MDISTLTGIKKITEKQILVLDTETTGVDSKAEVLQFSAIWGHGNLALNTYIKPSHTTEWLRAMAVNNITPDDVAKSPNMEVIAPKIERLFKKAKVIVGYNLSFDLRMLRQNGINLPPEDKVEYVDLMIPFAKIYGVKNYKTGQYKWQKLLTCAKYYGYSKNEWHDSFADAEATLFCFKKMLESGDLEIEHQIQTGEEALQEKNEQAKQKIETLKKYLKTEAKTLADTIKIQELLIKEKALQDAIKAKDEEIATLKSIVKLHKCMEKEHREFFNELKKESKCLQKIVSRHQWRRKK